MPFLPVLPTDHDSVARSVQLTNAANAEDDPERVPSIPELVSLELQYGWDLEPSERYLYLPTPDADPAGVLDLSWPKRDNRHLVSASIVIHPDHRRAGHGSAMIAEVKHRTRALGRDTIWISGPQDNRAVAAFAERHRFTYASHDARRRQLLADLDHDQLDRLYGSVQTVTTDYQLERLICPAPDETLDELVRVTAAINDAPMGELLFEDEKFDVQRLKDFETASAGKGDRLYRVFARHRNTGEIVGHTVLGVNPLRPTYGEQEDTAVARKHRGHRLGLLLKLEMLRWLAEVEPQLQMIETWNMADNTHMTNVNEALGYRLSRVYAAYQRILPEPSSTTENLITNAIA